MFSLVDGIKISVAGGSAAGDITVKLFDVIAPLHVSRIVRLAREGAYDGVAFHRVIDGFMAQTGDVQYGQASGDLSLAGTGGSGYPDLPIELSSVPFVRGVVGMARSSLPDTANSQFFMMFEYSYWLDGAYTVVGQVTDGIEVLDAIKRGESDRTSPSYGLVTEDPDYMSAVTLTTSSQSTLLTIDQATGDLSFRAVPKLATIDQTGLLVVEQTEDGANIGTVRYDDGINISDAVLILKQIVGLEQLTVNQSAAADANRDGTINISDAVAVLKHIVGLEPITAGVKVSEQGDISPAVSGQLLDEYTFIQCGDADLSYELHVV